MHKGTHKNPLHSGKVFEILLLDGGWLTPEGIAMEAGIQTDSARKALARYVSRGLVESRERPEIGNSIPHEYRISSEALLEYEC